MVKVTKTNGNESVKAILFCRVSTNQQDYERQVTTLREEARKDGYKTSEILEITCKESASKKEFDKAEGLRELEKAIRENTIESVYVTEMSRLTRRSDNFHKIMAILESRKIALVVLNPQRLRTYNTNNKGERVQDPIASVVIAFYMSWATNEIELKVERQKTGYATRVNEGKVCSSRVIFGYSRDSEGFAVPNEDAKIVADIFQMYLDGESCGTIYEKYKHQSIFIDLNARAGWNKVVRILSDKTYIGHNGKYRYPSIINEDTFNAVQQRKKGNTMIKARLKYVYYCQGLLKYEGHVMTPAVSETLYSYRNPLTGKSIGVNMNACDSLLWNLAAEGKVKMGTKADKDRKETTRKRLEEIATNLQGIKKRREDLNKAKEKLYNDYYKPKSKVPENYFNNTLNNFEKELKNLYEEEERLTQNRLKLENLLEDKVSKVSNLEEMYDYNAIIEITDDNERKAIINEVIREVIVTNTAKGTFELRVFYKDESLNNEAYYIYKTFGCKKQLLEVYGGGQYVTDLTSGIENRISRPQRRKKNG